MISPEEIHVTLDLLHDAAYELRSSKFYTYCGFALPRDETAGIDLLKKLAKNRGDEYLFFWTIEDQVEFEAARAPLYVSCVSAHGYYNEKDERIVLSLIQQVFGKVGIKFEWNGQFIYKIRILGLIDPPEE